jgi:hypothetical protein
MHIDLECAQLLAALGVPGLLFGYGVREPGIS